MHKYDQNVDFRNDKEFCEHTWSEAYCFSEDFTKIVSNGEECEYCGLKRGQII